MLDANLKTQLQGHFEKLTETVEIVASVDGGDKSREMLELLHDLQDLSPKFKLSESTDDAHRKPSFSLGRPGGGIDIRFSGIPMGHEFTSLVLALLQVGGVAPKLDAELIEQVKNVEGEFRFETFISLSCHNCPEVVQALNAMALLNPNIHVEMIDGGVFQEEVEKRGIMTVPCTLLNGQTFASGRMGVEDILAKIDTGASAREAAKLNEREPYDVLIVASIVEREVFRDEDVAYATAIWADGGDAELHVWPGGYHAFEGFAPQSRLAQEMTAARDNWIRRILD